MLLQLRPHGDRENRKNMNVLQFLKENIGKTQLIKKFITQNASPAKRRTEIKEEPGEKRSRINIHLSNNYFDLGNACSSKENTSDAGPSDTSGF